MSSPFYTTYLPGLNAAMTAAGLIATEEDLEYVSSAPKDPNWVLVHVMDANPPSYTKPYIQNEIKLQAEEEGDNIQFSDEDLGFEAKSTLFANDTATFLVREANLDAFRTAFAEYNAALPAPTGGRRTKRRSLRRKSQKRKSLRRSRRTRNRSSKRRA